MSRVLSYHQQPLEERILDYLKELSNHNKIEKIKYIDMAEYLKISDRHLRKVLKKLVEEQKILKNGKNIQIL